MKKNFFLLLIVISFVIGVYVLPNPSLALGGNNDEVLGLIHVPIFECLIGILFVFVVKKMYKNFNFGFIKEKIHFNLFVILPVLAPVIINIVTANSMNSILHQLQATQILALVSLSLVGALMVGFFEETLMRGALFNFFMAAFKNSQWCLLLSSIVSSVIFGLLHLGNLLGGAPLIYTLYQVVYAASLGFVFSMAYVKYQSLLVPIGMHTIIDYSDFVFNFTGEPSMNGIQWGLIIMTLVFVFCGIGLYKTINTASNSLGFQE